MTEQAATEKACYRADTEQTQTAPGPRPLRTVTSGRITAGEGTGGGRYLVLLRCGRPGGEEQQELGHGEDEDQQAEDRAERQTCGCLGHRGEVDHHHTLDYLQADRGTDRGQDRATPGDRLAGQAGEHPQKYQPVGHQAEHNGEQLEQRCGPPGVASPR